MKFWYPLAIAALALASTSVRADTATVQPYTCETDADCDKHFTNTVCISVDYYGVPVKKCTPNTKARPACRGAQPGMCPSYQSAEEGYLNLQCVFIASDGATMGSGSTAASTDGSVSSAATISRSRYLMSEVGMATNTTATTNTTAKTNTTTAPATVAPSATDDGSTMGDGSEVGSGSVGTADDLPGPKPSDKPVTVIINKVKVTGSFQCIDVSDCENKAYDPTTCQPKECGPSGTKEQCNTHGTCTYPSIQTMSKRRCMCNKGYGGDKCQTEISGACDTDCGVGGDCVDGVCSCKKGFDGKSYKGKAGKPNRRCTKCTNDLACQNDNACNIETGSCVCSPGYSGITCGATEDGCTKKNCGTGNCQVSANGTGVCMCPICSPTCQLCPTKDCSTCPSAAMRIQSSTSVLAVAALVTLLISNIAF